MARVKTSTRVITNRGQRRDLGIVSTPKAIGQLPTESSSEFDGLRVLDFDKTVATIRVQPCKVTIEHRGGEGTFRYTPDVEYCRHDGRIGYQEYKWSLAELDDEARERLQAAQAHFHAEGFEFSIVEGKELRETELLRNIRTLKRYRDAECPDDLSKSVLQLIAREGKVPLHRLRDHVGPPNYASLYRMAWDQSIVFDLKHRLSPFTDFRLGEP